jgi:hypothetical protein
MKYGRILVVTAVLLISFSLFNVAFGQSTQSSYTVKLNSFSLVVTYPAEVMPGDIVTVSVQGTPTGNAVYLQSLTATIYYADASGLHQLPVQNLVVNNSPNTYNNYVSYTYSGSFSKNFTVKVPESAPRTSLVAIFSETVQPNYYNYGGYAYNYPNYYSNLPYTYQGYPYYPYYPTYAYMSPAYYPYSYSSSSYGSDQAIAPLSYVKANTPESATLQSENQMLQQQLGQAQGQNQQLLTKVSQQSATIDQLTQQLSGTSGTIQMYQVLVLALGVLAAILLAFNINQRRSKEKPLQSVEDKAST